MRASLVAREPQRVAHWEKLDLYSQIQKRNASGQTFVLHDGPPFTNGDVHIGTALNKTLKDITLRYKSMRGYRTPYVPGWDCHGLPIEQKVTRELQEKKITATTAELRERCDAFSESWIAKQKAQFQRLGIVADWANEYKTKSPAFEADILRTFAAMVRRGLVYRSKKPVYWSIPFETALAEAEIEYSPHRSASIWVRFKISAEDHARWVLPSNVPASIVIWTTTPWTLPANLAIALHPELDYAFLRVGDEILVVAAAMVEKFTADCGLENVSEIRRVRGAELEHLKTHHPFIEHFSPVVLADYVTTESGTGCVHTAPGHGMDDYQTGLRYKLEVYCPVGDDGRYLNDGKVPADLVGISTLDTDGKCPANYAVVDKLKAAGALVKLKAIEHSYPHCWRSKTPIIFRAVDQWFVSLDTEMLHGPGGATARSSATKAIGDVQWIPSWGESRIRGAVESRPDWCVSRQRSWGVPIPAFYDAEKNAYLDADVICAIAHKIQNAGSNLWFAANNATEILEGISLPANWPAAKDLRAGRDTLDVWIDSGSSHTAVLHRRQGQTSAPADLYLEGSDQHRGWFQSSLWTSIIAHGAPPYRAVLTHGFIVDEERKKISKSSSYQKPQTSDAYIAEYGADVIRLWIASQDFRDDIPISKEILANVGETYRLLRNTLRFQLSVLYDFRHEKHAVPHAQLDAFDRWALHKTNDLVAEATRAYDAYEFHRVYQLVNQFCSVTLSSIYHDILKDRLYTLAPNAHLRRSSQTAIHAIFETLSRILAPITTFTADEAWSFAAAETDFANGSIHLQSWPQTPASWRDAQLGLEIESIIALRGRVNERLETLRKAGTIGKSLEAAITIAAPKGDAQLALLEKYRDYLPELLIVSQVELTHNDSALEITARLAEGERCPRCWRRQPTLIQVAAWPHVCPRCAEALNTLTV